jgi:hypothetical protein
MSVLGVPAMIFGAAAMEKGVAEAATDAGECVGMIATIVSAELDTDLADVVALHEDRLTLLGELPENPGQVVSAARSRRFEHAGTGDPLPAGGPGEPPHAGPRTDL